jgi:TPR repeat protein
LFIFNEISKTGDAESQYYLGLIYLTEDWPGKDIPKAISYLRSSADQNNAEAMWKLGDLYDNGLGVKKDLLIALDWYRKSKRTVTLKSKIQFQKNVNGKFIPQSTSDLINDMTKKSLDNNVEEQFKLANIYYDGQLVEPDDKQAFDWYIEAAKNSHSYSMLMVGYMYCRGIGVEKDINKANKWLEQTTKEAYCH